MQGVDIRLNPLGTTNETVSRLGLGMAALGRPGYINLGHGEDLGAARDVPTMEVNARRVLDDAWAAGIRYFDCAGHVEPARTVCWPGSGPGRRHGRDHQGSLVQRPADQRNTGAPFAGEGGTFRQEAECLGVGIDALALAAVLAQPWANVVLSGAVHDRAASVQCARARHRPRSRGDGSPGGPRRGSGHLLADTQQSEVELSLQNTNAKRWQAGSRGATCDYSRMVGYSQSPQQVEAECFAMQA